VRSSKFKPPSMPQKFLSQENSLRLHTVIKFTSHTNIYLRHNPLPGNFKPQGHWLDFYTLYILWLGIIRGCGRTALTMPLVCRNKGRGADIFLTLGFQRKPLLYSNVSAFALFSKLFRAITNSNTFESDYLKVKMLHQQ
jgi:hypothetical protein